MIMVIRHITHLLTSCSSQPSIISAGWHSGWPNVFVAKAKLLANAKWAHWKSFENIHIPPIKLKPRSCQDRTI